MILQAVIDRRDLTAGEVDRVLRVSEGLESDHQLSATLMLLATEQDLSGSGVSGVIETASRIESDHNLASVLVTLADRYEIEGTARARYRELADGMGSHQRSQVLAAIVR